MKFKVKNRDQFKKVRELLYQYSVVYNSNSNVVDISCDSSEHDMIINQLNLLTNYSVDIEDRTSIIYSLKASAIGSAIEPYVNELMSHYKNQIELFISDGANDFKDDVNSESEEPYLTYLNTVVTSPSAEYPSGKTVRDWILEKIT